MTALNSTVAEIRGTAFGQRLSEGRPALTTGTENDFFESWFYSTPSIYQDRLGINEGKIETKRRFFLVRRPQ